jgi:hypothetical protein
MPFPKWILEERYEMAASEALFNSPPQNSFQKASSEGLFKRIEDSPLQTD